LKKILLTTIHPAPYIDRWIDSLKTEYIVDLICVESHVEEKGWKNYENSSFKLYSDYSFFKKINEFKNYDLVILCGWRVKENIYISLILLFYKTKTAFFCDHPIINETKTDLFSYLIKRIVIKSSNYILAASVSCKNYISGTYNVNMKNIFIFPYAHSTSEKLVSNLPYSSGEVCKEGSKIKLLLANRFEERKGYSLVLEAFKLLNNKNLLEKFSISIAGHGSQFEYYKEKFKDLACDIKLVGWVENDEYEKFLNDSDIYLHASIFEPFGIPPIDALERGKIVIVSDGVKCLDSLINKNMDIGIYKYEAQDYNELSKILEKIIFNRNEIYMKCNQRINFVRKNFSTKINVNAIKKMIE
jgi:glycosyltransferase involved in cell wall biosynthesis